MNKKGLFLAALVAEDFGVKTETDRWLKANIHDSLIVDKEKGVFYWNSRNLIGDTLFYLISVRHLTLDQAREFLKKDLNYITDFKERIFSSLLNKKEDSQLVTPYEKLVSSFYTNGLNNREYFYNRGLTDKIIDSFRLGYYDGWYTIPIFDEGKFLNFQMRREKPEKKIKVYYSGLGQLIFNVDILKFVNEIFITEGPVDAMILIQNGLPAISTVSGVIQPKYFNRFINIKRINILFDNDSAGIYEAKKSAKILGENRCYIYCFEDFDRKTYDPVDFFRDKHTKEELLHLVNTRGRKVFEISNK